MNRKVFISVLGATNYGECDYQKAGHSYGPTRFIQVSTLRMLTHDKSWRKDHDAAYILLTKDAAQKNWVDGGQIDRNTKQPLNGLHTCLNELEEEIGSSFFPSVEPIFDLPIGNDENEIWQIFNTVFQKLENGDELYFDLTHGFRYLPMLILVLGNYAKFLKNSSVKSITYGNFEVSNFGKNPAPIVDLLPLSQLQDWTFAAGQFIESGHVANLVDLCKSNYIPILKDTKGQDLAARQLRTFSESLSKVIPEFQTCRGMSIIHASDLKPLIDSSRQLNTTLISAFDPVFAKIKDSLRDFEETSSIKNAFAAAKWCYGKGMYQQAITFLQEAVVSFFCNRHQISIDNEKEREWVNSAFYIKFYPQPEEKWRGDREKIKEILADPLLDRQEDPQQPNTLVCDFNNLSTVRNDINHSGMRGSRQPLKFKGIVLNIGKCLDDIGQLLFSEPIAQKTKTPLFVNLSNHPSTDWSDKQRQAAEQYGKIMDIEFPDIDPNFDSIGSTVDTYEEKIKGLAETHEVTVHVMGEMTFTFAFLQRMEKLGIPCVASTTERVVEDNADGTKTSKFQFVKFRRYE